MEAVSSRSAKVALARAEVHRCTLMAAQSPRPAPASRDSGRPGASNPPGGAVILVADDDATTRDVLADLLRRRGYVAETASDGQEAVERVAKGGVDLVLMDAMMPRLSGLEACRLVKSMTTEGFVAVILCTTKTDPMSRVEGLRMGADDYVCKPLEEAEVLSRVSSMLRIKAVHDQMQAARSTLERVSVIDELTGLFNYRYLHARLAEEFKRAEGNHEPLACCVVDVDGLRVHNDAGGRQLGDTVLRGLAAVVRSALREGDVATRYGGDEFLIVLPATHFAGSLAVAERIWTEARARSWEVKGGAVTVSIGIALFPSRDVRTKDALLRAADAALMHAKRDGMNRICVFQQQGFIYTPRGDKLPSDPSPGLRSDAQRAEGDR
jgi:two-component system cell cycle response regulator